MSSALNRTTKEFLPVANTPDFSPAQWILNSAQANTLFAAGVPTYYWNISGDVVTEMSQAEKDAVDAARLSAERDATANDLDPVESFRRAMALVLLDELNAHSAKIKEMLDQVDAATSLADLKARYALITDLPTRTLAQVKTALRNKLGT